MDKNIFAAFLLDKAEPLGVVKPLNSSFCQRTSPPFYIENCTSERKKARIRSFDSCHTVFSGRLYRKQNNTFFNTWAQIPIIQGQRYPLSSQKSTLFQKKVPFQTVAPARIICPFSVYCALSSGATVRQIRNCLRNAFIKFLLTRRHDEASPESRSMVNVMAKILCSPVGKASKCTCWLTPRS